MLHWTFEETERDEQDEYVPRTHQRGRPSGARAAANRDTENHLGADGEPRLVRNKLIRRQPIPMHMSGSTHLCA
jgi:hypothetical protein